MALKDYQPEMIVQEQLYCPQLEMRSQLLPGLATTPRFTDERAMKWNRAGETETWAMGTTLPKVQQSLTSWLTEIITRT